MLNKEVHLRLMLNTKLYGQCTWLGDGHTLHDFKRYHRSGENQEFAKFETMYLIFTFIFIRF